MDVDVLGERRHGKRAHRGGKQKWQDQSHGCKGNS
jgi:hypothetical protein